MLQTIIVVLAFVISIAYVGRLIYKSFASNEACNSGCAKCNAVDFQKIEQQLKNKGI